MKDSRSLLNTAAVPDVFVLKVNLRLKGKNADHRSVVRNNRLKCAGSWWGRAQVGDRLTRSGLLSCPFSPRRLRKQQQVWSAKHRGPERVLRCGGERLSESAMLRPPAPLQHPHPGQLWPGGHHHHQAAQVHVLLLPLLSTRGELNRFGSSFDSSVVILGGSKYKSPPQLEVQAPPGNPVGYIIQQWHPFSPKFVVANEHNEPVLKIHGPFCGWSCLPEVDFEVNVQVDNARLPHGRAWWDVSPWALSPWDSDPDLWLAPHHGWLERSISISLLLQLL